MNPTTLKIAIGIAIGLVLACLYVIHKVAP